jgi:hypothetical protein
MDFARAISNASTVPVYWPTKGGESKSRSAISGKSAELCVENRNVWKAERTGTESSSTSGRRKSLHTKRNRHSDTMAPLDAEGAQINSGGELRCSHRPVGALMAFSVKLRRLGCRVDPVSTRRVPMTPR